jgi:hypothetical protein
MRNTYWTKSGWKLLKVVAFNAAEKSGFESTVMKVIEDALELTKRVSLHPFSGVKIQNIYKEDRYYSTFNRGKVAVWRVDENEIVFVGAFSSLPLELLV